MLLISCGTMVSCQQQADDLKTSDEYRFFVSAGEATELIELLDLPGLGESTGLNSRSGTNPTIDTLLEAPDGNGVCAFYIATFEQNGYLVLSADLRVNPILAFSLTGTFPTEIEDVPTALVGWMKAQSDGITAVRHNSMQIKVMNLFVHGFRKISKH